jgi:hypothetical protein
MKVMTISNEPIQNRTLFVYKKSHTVDMKRTNSSTDDDIYNKMQCKLGIKSNVTLTLTSLYLFCITSL